MTKRFPSTVRFRLRRHPNRVHLTRSNVIRRNTAAPSPSSPLLSLVLGATPRGACPQVAYTSPLPNSTGGCPPSETELRHVERSLPAVPRLLAVHHAGLDGCFHASLPRNTCPRGVQRCHPSNSFLRSSFTRSKLSTLEIFHSSPKRR